MLDWHTLAADSDGNMLFTADHSATRTAASALDGVDTTEQGMAIQQEWLEHLTKSEAVLSSLRGTSSLHRAGLPGGL